jgi:hypothetical protein
MGKKLFWANNMASHDVNSLLIHGRFYDGDAVAEIHDGAVVKVGNLEDHTLYDGLKDLNVRKVTAPETDADLVAVVDIVNRGEGYINGVLYREGVKTAGMTASAGTPVRVRILSAYDVFTVGAGNISGEATVGKYLIPAAGETVWAVSDTYVAGVTNVYIEDENPLIEGVINTDTKYLCTVLPRTAAVEDAE